MQYSTDPVSSEGNRAPSSIRTLSHLFFLSATSARLMAYKLNAVPHNPELRVSTQVLAMTVLVQSGHWEPCRRCVFPTINLNCKMHIHSLPLSFEFHRILKLFTAADKKKKKVPVIKVRLGAKEMLTWGLAVIVGASHWGKIYFATLG